MDVYSGPGFSKGGGPDTKIGAEFDLVVGSVVNDGPKTGGGEAGVGIG